MDDYLPEISTAFMLMILGSAIAAVTESAKNKYVRRSGYSILGILILGILIFSFGRGVVSSAGIWMGFAISSVISSGYVLTSSAIYFKSNKKKAAIFLLSFFLLILFVAGSLARFVQLHESNSEEGVKPNKEISLLILNGVKQSVYDSFTIAAANGKYTRTPAFNHPASNLAAYIFNQKLGLSLQPGMDVVAAMAGQFKGSSDNVLVFASEKDDRFPFSVEGSIVLSMEMATKDKDGKLTKASNSTELQIIVYGYIDSLSRASVVERLELKK